MARRNRGKKVERARQLRKDATAPERILWRVLRNRRLGGLKFRRQHPIGPFLVDFVCDERRLVVELDGESHDAQRFGYDMKRQRFIEREGYRVLRIANDDVLNDIEAVAHGILLAAGMEVE